MRQGLRAPLAACGVEDDQHALAPAQCAKTLRMNSFPVTAHNRTFLSDHQGPLWAIRPKRSASMALVALDRLAAAVGKIGKCRA